MRAIYAILICLTICCSCHRTTEVLSPELSRVDSIMWDHPDSALALLEKMPVPSPSDKLEYATWCLLWTQAQDKNRVIHTSDSTINIALQYFEKGDNWKRKAQALFYKGQVAQDVDNKEEAAACYVKAKDMLVHFHDPLFASLVCQTLGSLYRYQKIYDESLKELRDGVNYALQKSVGNNLCYAYSELGRTFAECAEWDSAQHYFERSLDHGIRIADLKMQVMAFGELGVVARSIGEYEKALEYGKKDLEISLRQGYTRTLPQTKYSLGSIFRKMGELDSAKVYLKEALSTPNLYTKKAAYWGLYSIARDQKKFRESIDYNEQYQIYNDSLTNLAQTKAIAEIQGKYIHEKLEGEKKDLKLRNNQLLGLGLGVVMLLILVIAVLVYRYQRKLWLKECFIRESQEKIQENLLQLHNNDERIRENQELIQVYSEELQNKEELAKFVSEQYMQINKVHEENSYLQDQIKSLQKEIHQYAPLVKEESKWALKLNELTNENAILRSREKYLLDYLMKNVDPFKKIREDKQFIKDADWDILKEHINRLYNQFTVRLCADFPALSDYNVHICCLIKLKCTTSQISTLVGVSAPSVTKQKQRIRDCMSLHKKDLAGENMTLEIYLTNY